MGGRHRAYLRIVSLFSACFIGLVTPALANSKYAAYVIHAETGDILFDRYSNAERYPASLTKMMTLYLLFEAIEEEKYSLSDKLTVSKRASLQPASRLGLARGSKISVEKAIEALVIKSANDVATVVAESLAGSEARFAQRMTKKARELGMRRTTFRNASGLPDRRQKTTARDMAILAQRVSQDFPQYFHFFDKSSFTWKGRKYTSHNKVARTYPGADGLKTGYTRASGYNLATTAAKGDHRLIGIVLGGRSGATRDRHMKDILNESFAAIRRRPSLIKAVHRVRPVPGLRPDRKDGPGIVLAAATPTIPQVAEEIGTAEALNIASLQKVIEQVANDDSPLQVAPIGQGDADFGHVIRTWAIQVGAYSQQAQAIARIKNTQDLIQTVSATAGREVNIADAGARAIYRARFTRLTEAEAQNGCEAVRAMGDECIAMDLAQ